MSAKHNLHRDVTQLIPGKISHFPAKFEIFLELLLQSRSKTILANWPKTALIYLISIPKEDIKNLIWFDSFLQLTKTHWTFKTWFYCLSFRNNLICTHIDITKHQQQFGEKCRTYGAGQNSPKRSKIWGGGGQTCFGWSPKYICIYFWDASKTEPRRTDAPCFCMGQDCLWDRGATQRIDYTADLLLTSLWDKTASGTGRSNKKDILHSRSAPPFSMGEDCLWNSKKHNVGDLNPLFNLSLYWYRRQAYLYNQYCTVLLAVPEAVLSHNKGRIRSAVQYFPCVAPLCPRCSVVP